MSKSAFAVVGDLHMAPHVYSEFPTMRGDSEAALDQIIDYCDSHNLPLYLAGDSLDKCSQRSEMIGLMHKAVERLGEVWAVQGQHEKDTPPWISSIGGFYTGDGVLRNLGGLTVVGLDYEAPRVILEKLANVPPCDVLILHQMIKESTVGIKGAYDIELADLPEQAKLIIAGDNHNGWSVKLPDGRTVTYTGSMRMCSRNEPLEKHFLVVHDDLTIEVVPLKTRPYLRFEIVSENILDAALKKIRGAVTVAEGDPSPIAQPFVHIKYLPEIENLQERVRVACDDKAFLKLVPFQSVETHGEETEVVEGSTTLEGCLAEVVDQKADPELFEFVQALLASEAPKDVVAVWKGQYEEGQRPKVSTQVENVA